MTYKVGRCLLKNLLDAKGMTQTQLASKLNISKQQIQHYVQNNRIMSLQVAYNISKTLNCDITELYDWKAGKE